MEKDTTRKGNGQKEKKSLSLKDKLANIWTGLKSEFDRIIWLDKESLTKRTTVVVIASVALGALIAIVDMLVKFGLGFLIA